MVARKKVCRVESVVDAGLREELRRSTTSERDCDAMLKDAPLIEAALRTDRLVVSLDETVRSLFARAAEQVRVLDSIAWVNPDKTKDQTISWLEANAERERSRLLGSATQ
jgi:hypothetical protein